MAEAVRLGDIVDALGVIHHPEDGELISDVIVLMKTIDNDGRVGLRSCYSPGMSWIERTGMLRIAEQTELADLKGEPC